LQRIKGSNEMHTEPQEILMYTVATYPVCVDCGGSVNFFVHEGRCVVGVCGCKRNWTMTFQQYSDFERLDNVVSQSILLASLNISDLVFGVGLQFKQNRRELLFDVADKVFGSNEVVVDRLVDWLRLQRLLQRA
jgi:hypothetical protein